MQQKTLRTGFFLWMIVCSFNGLAQEDRIQYPPVLKNSYFGVNIGHINYAFSSRQLNPGYTVGSVRVPHTAVRIVLFGHQFNKNLSAQITYMRPVKWVEYRSINGDNTTYTAWMNVAGLTAAGKLPLGKKVSIFGEAGLGLIMRKGFKKDEQQVVPNASYATGLFGGSLQFHPNKRWDLQLTSAWSPAHGRDRQPATLFIGAGFNYYMRTLPAARVEAVKAAGYHFPKQMIYAGLSTNAVGYKINTAVSQGAIPIFWGGEARVKRGFLLNYQRNIFHTRKVFALDWGAGIGIWKSQEKKQSFITLSAYPVFRFTLLRSATADFYFEYSVAGPTFINKTFIDDEDTGRKFTFQDMMGIGVFAGRKKNINAGLRVAHYSNGNLFPANNGVMVPLTFSLGHAF
jgi:hypothetical protein